MASFRRQSGKDSPPPKAKPTRRSPPSSPVQSKQTKHEQARDILQAFWGASNGGDIAYTAMQDGLKALKLSRKKLIILRVGLTIPEGSGTTAVRLKRAGQCLELLEIG